MNTTGQLFSNSTSTAQQPGQPTFAELYERMLVAPLFRPWAEELLERVALTRGAHVLDVACGTGILARLAREQVGSEGRVVGVDRSPLMLTVAQEIEPGVDWREGDAGSLPVKNGERFEAAFCHQGLQFFQDRPAAIGAMRDALKPGGRVAIGVWRPLEDNGVFHDLALIAERTVGPIEDVRHSFGDAGALARLLTEAGFVSVRVEALTRTVRMEALPLVQLNTTAVVTMSAAGRDMSDAAKAAATSTIVSESVAELAPRMDGGFITFQTSANIAVGYV
jgi:ubiquinone/menaquinone biosynthesis C-methylase UbiE